MLVKPVLGRRVPDPERGDVLPEEGREVEPTQYWLRRFNDGDVVIIEAPASEVGR